MKSEKNTNREGGTGGGAIKSEREPERETEANQAQSSISVMTKLRKIFRESKLQGAKATRTG